MKIVIDITEDTYKVFKNLSKIIGILVYEKDILRLIKAVKKGTPLPDNATNGDVIKALFPNEKFEKGITIIHNTSSSDRFMSFDYEWWNTPYTKENK